MRTYGGHRLRALREALGYKMRDVESASAQIAQKFDNEEFAIVPSRLSDIEPRASCRVSIAFTPWRLSIAVSKPRLPRDADGWAHLPIVRHSAPPQPRVQKEAADADNNSQRSVRDPRSKSGTLFIFYGSKG